MKFKKKSYKSLLVMAVLVGLSLGNVARAAEDTDPATYGQVKNAVNGLTYDYTTKKISFTTIDNPTATELVNLNNFIIDYIAAGEKGGASSAIAYGTRSIAFGYGAKVIGPSGTTDHSIAIGYNAEVNSISAIAMGDNAKAERVNSVAIGRNANATANHSVAIGYNSVASEEYTVSVGRPALSGTDSYADSTQDAIYRRIVNVADGVNDYDAVNMKQLQDVISGGTPLGYIDAKKGPSGTDGNAHADAYASTAVGYRSLVSLDGENSTALGNSAMVYGAKNSTAVGAYATVTSSAATNSTALGYKTEVIAQDAVALGANAKVSGHNSVAIGANSYAGESDTVSVGKYDTYYHTSLTRRIVNVKNGTADTDAATYGQVKIAVNNLSFDSGTKKISFTTIGNDTAQYLDLSSLGGGGGDSLWTAGDSGTGSIKMAGGSNVATGDYSLAMGLQSTAGGNYSLAAGYNSKTEGASSVAIGADAVAKGYASVSLGQDTEANDSNAVALGYKTKANAKGSTATGYGSEAYGEGSFAGGGHVTNTQAVGGKAYGESSFAFGTGAVAGADGGTGNYTFAFGKDALASKDNAIAFGSGAKAEYTNSVALGSNSETSAENTVSVGKSGAERRITNVADGTEDTDAVNLGQLKNLSQWETGTGTGSVALKDFNNVASGVGAVALGKENTASGEASTAMGFQSTAGGNYSLAAGYNSKTEGASSVAIGADAVAKGYASVSLGQDTEANDSNAVALGYKTKANAKGSTATGYGSEAYGEGSFAGGGHVTNSQVVGGRAYGESSFAFGTGAVAGADDKTGNYTFAFGDNALASKDNAIAFGSGAKAEYANSVALGSNSVTSAENTVSVGSTSLQRRITNVAAGTADTDAVNVAQMNAAINGMGGGGTAPNYLVAPYTSGDHGATATQQGAIALGYYTEVLGDDSKNAIALGYKAKVLAEGAMAVGGLALADNNSATALGYKAHASAENSTALGSLAFTTGNASVALGHDAYASGNTSIALGEGSVANTENVVSVGHQAGDRSWSGSTYDNTLTRKIINVADGENDNDAATFGQVKDAVNSLTYDSTTNKIAFTTIGNSTPQYFDLTGGGGGGRQSEADVLVHKGGDADKTAIIGGTNTEATGKNGLALGNNSKANAENAVSVGYKNELANTAKNSTAVGAENIVSGERSTAVGYKNTVTGNRSGAFGDPNNISGSGSYALGNDNTITGNNTFVLGNNVTASSNNSVILGNGSSDGGANTVSVGAPGAERKIVNVAKGTNETDAVNYGQLQAALGETGTGEAFYALQDKVENMGNRIDKMGTKINKVGAGAAALAAMHPVCDDDCNLSFSAGLGAYKGERAVAVGMFYRFNPRVMMNCGAAVGNDNNMYNIGFNFALDRNVEYNLPSKAAMAKQIELLTAEVEELKKIILAMKK